MQCTSTGLGKRKLQLNVLSADLQEDSLVVTAKSYAPVIWDIRIIVEPRDLPTLVKLLVTRAALSFLGKALWGWRKMLLDRRAGWSQPRKAEPEARKSA